MAYALFAGLTITIDVRHSRVMKRQYLNVFYSPTAAYKGHTEGLCGFMDNNATNDFIGPDGTPYQDAIQFAESCKQHVLLKGHEFYSRRKLNSPNAHDKMITSFFQCNCIFRGPFPTILNLPISYYLKEISIETLFA